MARENTFSLTVMVIILAMLGLFVGYLLGNWFIQFVTGETPQQQQLVDKKVVEEDLVVEDNKEDAESFNNYTTTTNQTVKREPVKPEPIKPENDEEVIIDQKKGEVFVVQVGAFNNRDNALALKEQLAEDGFQAVVTDSVPYKVQLGATIDRDSAEQTEKKIKALGYNAFITH